MSLHHPTKVIGDQTVGNSGTSSSKTLSQTKGLLHLSHDCPGLTGPGSHMEVLPTTFLSIFSLPYPITIPLLQRSFCWTDSEINQWWKDAALGANTRRDKQVSGKHGTGKCIFKLLERENQQSHLICIDGQQRSTIQQILLAAFRDAALIISQRYDISDHNKANLCIIVDNIETLLFMDVAAMRSWAQSVAQDIVKAIIPLVLNSSYPLPAHEQILGSFQTTVQKKWAEMFPEGTVVSFAGGVRLLPSFVDRSAYFETILSGRCAHEVYMSMRYWHERTSTACDGTAAESRDLDHEATLLASHLRELASVAREVILRPTTVAAGSKQGRAKSIFDRNISTLLLDCSGKGSKTISGESAFTTSSADDKARIDASEGPLQDEVALKNSSATPLGTISFSGKSVCVSDAIVILRQTINSVQKMGLTYCEITSDINVPQVFLWLQEKHLFGMGALLWNPTPGLAFRACDMIRNLLLSGVMHLPVYEQETFLRQYWLYPIEIPVDRLNACDTDFDNLLREFLIHKEDSCFAEIELVEDATSLQSGSSDNLTVISEERDDDHNTGGPGDTAKTGSKHTTFAVPLPPVTASSVSSGQIPTTMRKVSRWHRSPVNKGRRPRPRNRYLGALELKVKDIRSSLPPQFADKMTSESPMGTYARFHSYVEYCEIRGIFKPRGVAEYRPVETKGAEHSNGGDANSDDYTNKDDPAVAISRETSEGILVQLADFVRQRCR